MALYYNLPIYRDIYNLILKIFEATRDFPREYKYTLGQDMKRDGMELMRLVYKANKYKDKREFLENLLDNLEIIKLQIRLAYDLKIISVKKQAVAAELIDAIGRQTNGWKRNNEPELPK